MVRTADHVARRTAMTAALLTIAAESGLESVTVAKVARAANVSVGLVQHYFSSKDALIQAAYTAALAAVDERVADTVERGERRGQTIRTMALQALSEFLPLDESRRQESVLRTQFLALATQDADLASTAAATDAAMLKRLRHVINNGKQCGEVAPETNDKAAAIELLTIVTGVMTRSVVTGEDGRVVLKAAIERTFSGECRRHH